MVNFLNEKVNDHSPTFGIKNEEENKSQNLMNEVMAVQTKALLDREDIFFRTLIEKMKY